MRVRMREDESLNKRKAGGGSTGHYRLGQRAHTPKLQFSWQRALCRHFPRCHLSSGRDRQAYALAIISDSP